MTRLAALMLSFQIGGCARIRSHLPLANQPPPAAPTSSHAHRQAPPGTAREQPTKEEKETDRAGSVRKEPATASVPAQTPPAGAANVTLEDNDADHSRAQALLDDADSRIAHIDRSKLTGEKTATYNQASDLANAARKAMAQHDYLAASGLARKAALLTAQLAPRTSSR
jgi:hypothetical protein